jgi:predicted nucleic acid-binding protein
MKSLNLYKLRALRFPIYIEPDFAHAVSISKQTNMYGYDAYFIDCALRHKAPLPTLDLRLKEMAKSLKISVLEV